MKVLNSFHSKTSELILSLIKNEYIKLLEKEGKKPEMFSSDQYQLLVRETKTGFDAILLYERNSYVDGIEEDRVFFSNGKIFRDKKLISTF